MSKTVFCMAPFVHMYVQTGERKNRVCCVAEPIDNKTLEHEEDFSLKWSGDSIKNIRKEMMEDNVSDRIKKMCNTCIAKEESVGFSDRTQYNKRYSDIVPNIVTGNQFNGAIDLDLRPGNLCNLACRMCWTGSSSQLEKEVRNGKISKMWFLGPPKIDLLEMRTDKNIEFILKNINKCRRIKFLGGEPTIMPEVHELMDLMIENDATDAQINITTNLTNVNKKFINKLSKFSNIHFTYSIDGTGKTVEYIRHPVKWKSIEENMKIYDSIANTSSINFAFQAYNVHNVKEFYEWTRTINKDTVLNIERVNNPQWDNISVLPEEYIKHHLSGIEHNAIKHVLTNSSKRNIIEYDRFIKHTKILDNSRNQHIKDYIPEIWELIKEDYNALQI